MSVTTPSFQIILNGVSLNPSDFSGTKDSKVVIKTKDKTRNTYSYSNDIELYGQGRQIIVDNIINATNPYTVGVDIVIKDTCCRDDNGDYFTIFEGQITYQDIDFCESFDGQECKITVNAEDNSQQAKDLQCINDTIIIARESLDGSIQSSGEDEVKPAVYFRYCIEDRSKVMGFLRLFFIISNVVFVFPILASIYLALTILTFGAINIVDTLEFQKNLVNSLIGCSRKHKAPFIYSYLRNVCKLCGLTLSSSLFEVGEPYNNLTYFWAPFEKGKEDKIKADDTFRDYNFPSETLTQFLEKFQTLNIDYTVENSTLIVERKDFFTNNIWIDFAGREADIIEQCYTFGDDPPKSGRVYEYAQDASDLGEEANRLWGGDVIDYNDPYNPVLRGVDRVIVPFSPARFKDDNFGSVVNGFDLGFLNFFGVDIPDDVLLLATGSFSTPKLLMWDGTSDREDARVKRGVDPLTGTKIYNLDGWLRQNGAGILAGGATFYDRLLFIDDPRLAGQVDKKLLNFTLVFTYTCEDLRNFKIGARIYLYRDGIQNEGTVDELEIDYQKKQMKITGKL